MMFHDALSMLAQLLRLVAGGIGGPGERGFGPRRGPGSFRPARAPANCFHLLFWPGARGVRAAPMAGFRPQMVHFAARKGAATSAQRFRSRAGLKTVTTEIFSNPLAQSAHAFSGRPRYF